MPDLVLVRHGQSTWNAQNLFTGWVDVDLSPLGEAEARAAGTLLATEQAGGLDLRVLHTSVLKRAIRTANFVLDELDRAWLPVRRSWKLNERHYGALQGKNKKETAEEFGADQVKKWRRSYDVPPPDLSITDPSHPSHDTRYRDVPADLLPSAECLADVVKRMLPYWDEEIVPDLLSYGGVLVAAHGNSIRALVKYLKGISDDDIVGLEVPTGVPWLFHLDDNVHVVSDSFLGDPEQVAAAAEAVARQAG
jgi:2,3-bisphosphoglycerate-dependent phosphoglycerate mutase